jgi:hypothetical protein
LEGGGLGVEVSGCGLFVELGLGEADEGVDEVDLGFDLVEVGGNGDGAGLEGEVGEAVVEAGDDVGGGGDFGGAAVLEFVLEDLEGFLALAFLHREEGVFVGLAEFGDGLEAGVDLGGEVGGGLVEGELGGFDLGLGLGFGLGDDELLGGEVGDEVGEVGDGLDFHGVFGQDCRMFRIDRMGLIKGVRGIGSGRCSW